MRGKDNLRIRAAGEKDVKLILHMIRALAEYERMADQVTATEVLLVEWLFEKRVAEVLIAESGDNPVGFALYFFNFSTFLGKAGIYLEDLYVLPEYRRRGIGKRLLQTLASKAIERGCGRLEWSCLNWNEASIRFYRSLGAAAMSDWTVYRLTGETLAALADDASDPNS